MNIKLFGYSISLNVLILIGILYLIMLVNALSGACNREGMDQVTQAPPTTTRPQIAPTTPVEPEPEPIMPQAQLM